MLLKDIIGQDAVKRELCHSVQEGKIPHALLLSGSAGVGKLPLALAFAQYVACKHRTDTDACGVCPTCLQYSKLQHPDLHFAFPIVKVDKGAEVCDDYLNDFREMVRSNPYCDPDDWTMAMGAEKKQSLIYEKESSEIQRKLSLKSFADGYKVMIVWQPEKMHIACANKLLKLLEEPPEMTLFLFVSEHPEQLLPTIISRLRPLPIPRLTDEEIMAAIRSQQSAISEQQARDVARLAGGSYREALRILDAEDRDKQLFAEFQELMRNAWLVGVRKNYEALQKLNEWSMTMAKESSRERQCAFLQFAQRLIRENFIYNYGEPALNYETSDEQQFSVKFAPFINERNIEELTEQFARAEAQIMQNANARMVLFDLCLQCIVLIKR
ncbi:MAG: DNA polymerase III subunit delta [Paludibacteraceae bacterium]|nr:DNA polymerase III subunit delta [Paludibacteraceae bacterium]